MTGRTSFLFILAFWVSISASAQDGPSIWTEMEFSKKIVKNLKAEFNPELRLLDGFKMDSYILEGGLSYKLHKYLTLASYYRYENEYKYKKKSGEYKGQESSNRFAFDAKTPLKLSRFDIQFRLRYTNGSDRNEETPDRVSFFRYRAKFEYDIKGSKLAPFASAELFHDLVQKEIDKGRYTFGLSYPINKSNEVGLFYRFQDYFEPENTVEEKKGSINIIGIGYSFKF
jgi:hypothetical protein